jgi:hypothetical protein
MAGFYLIGIALVMPVEGIWETDPRQRAGISPIIGLNAMIASIWV